MIGAPSPLRDELVVLTKRTLVNRCLRLRPETEDSSAWTDPNRLLTRRSQDRTARSGPPLEGTRRRDQDPQQADRGLVRAAAPDSSNCTASASRSPGSSSSPPATTPSASAARPPSPNCVASRRNRQQRPHHRPPPAQPRRRPSREQRALHRHHRSDAPSPAHPRLRRAAHRRRASKREIIRCLKRYIAREIYANLPRSTTPPAATGPPEQLLDKHRSIERYNRILAEEFLYAREWTSDHQRDQALHVWNVHYNYHRPHTAAGNQPPANRLHTGVTNVVASYI